MMLLDYSKHPEVNTSVLVPPMSFQRVPLSVLVGSLMIISPVCESKEISHLTHAGCPVEKFSNLNSCFVFVRFSFGIAYSS